MFTVTEPDYTAAVAYFIGLGVVVTVVVFLVVRSKLKKRKLNGGKKPEYTGMSTEYIFTVLFGTLLSMGLLIGAGIVTSFPVEDAYKVNVGSTEEALNDKYSGDFTIEAYGESDSRIIDFSSLEEVESAKVTVERKLDGDVYVYRLAFVDGEPDVVKVVTSDSVQYPSLTE